MIIVWLMFAADIGFALWQTLLLNGHTSLEELSQNNFMIDYLQDANNVQIHLLWLYYGLLKKGMQEDEGAELKDHEIEIAAHQV